MTNNVRFLYTGGLQLVLSKANRVGDTKFNVKCSKTPLLSVRRGSGLMWASLCVENTRVHVSYMHPFLVDSVTSYSWLTLIILQVDSIKLVEHHVIEDCDLDGIFFSALAYKYMFSNVCAYARGCQCNLETYFFYGGEGGGGEELMKSRV